MISDNLPDKTQFLLYSTEDGKITKETRLEDELTLEATIRKFRIVRTRFYQNEKRYLLYD
ncbi:MAG: hypothetical protein D4R64_15285 [Porphyromonadaceae bacterium]|nr:MAG: hypothetical protein D4R64_15285 [Porphyromonadaceae bacterium]